VPAKQSLGLHDDDRSTPAVEQSRAQKELEPVDQVKLGPVVLAAKNAELVTKNGVLDEEVAPRAAQIGGGRDDR